MAESKLVKELFLVSPVYNDKFRKTGRDSEGYVTAIKPDDDKDTLPDWLASNSMVEHQSNRDRESISGSYRFMGENGVYCKVYQKKVQGEHSQIDFALGEYGDYRRAVRILAMPASRDIPPELSSAFTSRGYEIAMRNSWEVRILMGA